MSRLKTQEKFESEIREIVGDEYTVLGNYIGNSKKVKLKHLLCDYEWDVIPLNFFSKGSRCPKCSGNAKLTYKYVSEYVESFGYSLISKEYKNARTKLHLKCPNKHDHHISYDDFRIGKRCGMCVGGIRLEFEFVKKRFIELGLTPLFEEYQNQQQKLPYICPMHTEEIQYISWNCISQGHGCEKCGNIKKLRFGKDNHAWKGGTTPLIAYLRESINEWKFKSLEKNRFVCVLTNKNDMDLEIHHLSKGYTEILHETLEFLNIDLRNKINEYEESELILIKNKFIELHSIYGLGVPIKSSLHTLFHRIYGYGGNSKEQFEEFTIRFNTGEFKEVISYKIQTIKLRLN